MLSGLDVYLHSSLDIFTIKNFFCEHLVNVHKNLFFSKVFMF